MVLIQWIYNSPIEYTLFWVIIRIIFGQLAKQSRKNDQTFFAKRRFISPCCENQSSCRAFYNQGFKWVYSWGSVYTESLQEPDTLPPGEERHYKFNAIIGQPRPFILHRVKVTTRATPQHTADWRLRSKKSDSFPSTMGFCSNLPPVVNLIF